MDKNVILRLTSQCKASSVWICKCLSDHLMTLKTYFTHCSKVWTGDLKYLNIQYLCWTPFPKWFFYWLSIFFYLYSCSTIQYKTLDGSFMTGEYKHLFICIHHSCSFSHSIPPEASMFDDCSFSAQLYQVWPGITVHISAGGGTERVGFRQWCSG